MLHQKSSKSKTSHLKLFFFLTAKAQHDVAMYVTSTLPQKGPGLSTRLYFPTCSTCSHRYSSRCYAGGKPEAATATGYLSSLSLRGSQGVGGDFSKTQVEAFTTSMLAKHRWRCRARLFLVSRSLKKRKFFCYCSRDS